MFQGQGFRRVSAIALASPSTSHTNLAHAGLQLPSTSVSFSNERPDKVHMRTYLYRRVEISSGPVRRTKTATCADLRG